MTPPCIRYASFRMVIVQCVVMMHVHYVVAREKEPNTTSHVDAESSQECESKAHQEKCVCTQFLLL